MKSELRNDIFYIFLRYFMIYEPFSLRENHKLTIVIFSAIMKTNRRIETSDNWYEWKELRKKEIEIITEGW